MKYNIEDTTRELLKKSLLTIPDKDFSNRVMERIHMEAPQKKTILSSISKAWIFTVLSFVLFPFGLSVIVKSFQSFTFLSSGRFMIDTNSLSIILSIFFATVILFILDSLIRLTLSRKHHLFF